MLLSLERSTPIASVALFSDGPEKRCIASTFSSGAGSGDAFSMVSSFLEVNGVSPQEITSFAVGIGPGSFSGVRSALGLVQGLALPQGCPVYGVSTPAAMLRCYRKQNPDAPHLRVLGDARRGHLWCLEEPADYHTLTHTAADIKLFSIGEETPTSEKAVLTTSPIEPLSALNSSPEIISLLADPARLSILFESGRIMGLGKAFADEPSLVSLAEEIALLALGGCAGAPTPIYLHPAVVGRVVSAV